MILATPFLMRALKLVMKKTHEIQSPINLHRIYRYVAGRFCHRSSQRSACFLE
ncbi:hypothetical protein RBWH47_05900 [Rhodopirellula baltica WH47]|uniref:Uncharacterized protein n=1 Tax=Rhodopirellula baltica WH47 TaxID=991778 RepID=F2AW76_RHOBT|nr:hypothetical protein RBWH47_05900 [Rhodopirellula baltica WH47]